MFSKPSPTKQFLGHDVYLDDQERLQNMTRRLISKNVSMTMFFDIVKEETIKAHRLYTDEQQRTLVISLFGLNWNEPRFFVAEPTLS